MYHVMRRPDVEKFIETASKKFTIVIYTSSLLEVITQLVS